MALMTSAKLLTAGAVWRIGGSTWAGDTLVEAACSDDENDQTLAGMLLVQAGDRSISPIVSVLASGEGSLVLVDLLTSIGSPEAKQSLEELTKSGGAFGEAAIQALRDLAEIRRMEE